VSTTLQLSLSKPSFIRVTEFFSTLEKPQKLGLDKASRKFILVARKPTDGDNLKLIA